MALDQVIEQVNKHFAQYTNEEIEQIIQRVSINDEHIIEIQPPISLADDPHNLHFTIDKSYRRFVKKMRKHGLFVHTNIDAFKVSKLVTLNKVREVSPTELKATQEVPDIKTITFNTYRLSNRVGSKLLDTAFYHLYLKYQ